MKKKLVKAMACAAALTMVLSLSACGGSGSDSSESGAADDAVVEEVDADEEETSGYTVSYGVLYDDNEEEKYVFPFNPVGSPYAEAMMQVNGYDWTLETVDDANYELTLVYSCGEDSEDTTMYMERTYVFGGTYTADGDTYTLDVPTTLQFSQHTAGQFAATSGEGGADTWGPDGLEFDETYTNDDGYNGCTASDILAAFSACTVTVDGSEITGFELL